MGPSGCETIYCDSGFMFSAQRNACIEDPNYVVTCGVNQVYLKDRHQCECLQGHFYDKNAGQCTQISCKVSEKWSWKWMRCIPLNCPALMQWNDSQGKCDCMSKSSFCEKPCPTGYTTNKKCNCERIPNFQPSTDLCGNNKVWSPRHWICIDRASTCSATQQYSPQSGRCITPDCGHLQYWNIADRRCACNAGSFWDSDKLTCVEIDCGRGFKYDLLEGACAVDQTYRPSCPSLMVWSGVK